MGGGAHPSHACEIEIAEHPPPVPVFPGSPTREATMKLMTMALAGALALSATFALAQSIGGGKSGAGSSTDGSATGTTTGSSVNGNEMANPPGSTVGRARRHQRAQHRHESIREYARAQWLAQRIDLDADRTGLRHQPVGDGQAINEKPRLVRGFLSKSISFSGTRFDGFSSAEPESTGRVETSAERPADKAPGQRT